MEMTLTTRTSRGTTLTLTATGRHEMIADLPGQPGIRVTEGELQGVRCLHGYATRAGRRVPMGIEITPEIRVWLDEVAAERKAATAARAEIAYVNLNTWEPSTWTVDLRQSTDEIIAGLPQSVRESLRVEEFGASIEQIRAERTSKTKAREAAEARASAAVAKAAETGKPVEIDRRMVPCDGTAEDCSTDLVIRLAMPDGTIHEARTHTC